MEVKEIIERIDSGGFGNVDRVLCDDGNEYAMKTFSMNIPHDDALKQNAISRFKREALFQATFKHKNIVPILFKDLTGDVPYYIMPLALKALKNEKLADKNEIHLMLLDVMSGLEEMHNKSVYHRDLKPGNILKFEDNGEYYYAIGDFGLLSIDQTNITDLTPVSMQKGSDYYTAPEIVANLKRASIQSDIFSLGCLIHDYYGKSSRIPCQPIIEEGSLGKIMLNCTHKNIRRRFNSVQYLRETLISINYDNVETKSEEGERIVKLIESKELLSNDDWIQVIEFVENDKNSSDDISTIFKMINLQNISTLSKLDEHSLNSYGALFADWVRDRSFLFSSCDIIGERLNFFIKNCPINIKSQCIMSLLFLGTSHNRFYVERLCLNWLYNDIDDDLAEILAIELMTEGSEVCYNIRHLERSINITRNNFHPKILDVIKDIC